MNVLRILRFFLPGENPLGFSLPDAIELFVAAMGLIAILCRRKIVAAITWLAERPRLAMLVLFLLPIVLRLALLGQHPVPIPTVPDDFSFLLLGDTLAHFRLANPVHPMHRFFESLFILQEPSYSSIYPPGQGIVLALFGHPWAGVLVSVGVFCALCFWMLRAWVPPPWALCGGLLAVAAFGPLSKWTNDYWGGALSAIAGCLVFGATKRNNPWLAGVGIAIQVLTRPFEALLLAAVVPSRRMLPPIMAAGVLMLFHNHAVTGSWTTLPYQASRAQYGVPATFTFQENARPNRTLTPSQQLAFEVEKATHDHPITWPERLSALRFFLLAQLFAAIPFALARRNLWAFATIAFFLAGTAFYPYFYPHYIAAVTCLFLLLAVAGLERLSRITLRGFDVGADTAMVVLILCGAHFVFWYGLHLAGNSAIFSATSQYEEPDYINYGDSEGRRVIARELAKQRGDQLVFVHYSAAHTLSEWVYNAADIDHSRVVWALDRGADENHKLQDYYPSRKVWLLEPDASPLRLRSYP